MIAKVQILRGHSNRIGLIKHDWQQPWPMAEVQQCTRCGAWMVPPLHSHDIECWRSVRLSHFERTQLPTEIEMKHDRDRLQEIMEMFHQFDETMISADSLQEAIECGVLEANGFARNREEAQELGQAMVEHGFVFDRNRTDS